MIKYLILKNGLVIAEFYEKGYALDFIDYQITLGKEFILKEEKIERKEKVGNFAR